MSDPFSTPVSASTRVCGVLGWPVRHSASPAMQNAAMAHLKLDWRYHAFGVQPSDLRSVIEGAKSMHMIGLNLTVPHKLLALEMMDHLDQSARQWGAVNTVVFEAEDGEGVWRPLGQQPHATGKIRACGHNTDADAIIRSIAEDLAIEPRGARVLLLGAGGAGRAAALRLADEGVCELWLVNRTESKAVELAREIQERFPAVSVEVGYPRSSVEIILNATSLGLRPDDPLPMDVELYPLAKSDTVYDMVYRPAQTRLLAAAIEAGCRTANGLGMLLYQGAAALELWCGIPAPIGVMRAALEHEIYP